MIAHRHASIDGLRLHWLEAGAGEPVVLLAGWPQTVHAWRHVLPRLAQRYRVHALDMPGFGDSEKPLDGYDTRRMAGRVRAWVRQLGHERIRLVTHDIGSWVGYPYAALYPETVRCLVLMDAAVPGLAPEAAYAFEASRVHRNWHFFFNALPDLPEALVTGRERAFLAWLFASKLARTAAIGPADLDEYVRCYSAPGALRAGFAWYRAKFESMRQNRELAAAGKLAMPVLAVGGEAGLGDAMGAMLGPVCARLQGATIAGCGHYIPEEAPDELMALLEPFLAAAPA